MDETPKDSRDIELAAFVKGMTPADVRPSTFEPRAAPADADADAGPASDAAPTAKEPSPATSAATPASMSAGQRWPIDQLIGQINGKPFYADEFLKSREDRIRRIVALPDRAVARQQLLRTIDEAFDSEVNNELVISEAQSSIPEEAKESLLTWMRDLQEKEIAKRGGTRTEAQRSISEEYPGMTVEEFTSRQKDAILASDLLHKRVSTRTIVSWRDVERLYVRNWDQFNPLPTLRVARIAVLKSDAAKLEQVQQLFAKGSTFAQVAQALQLPNGGLWQEFKLGPAGIDGLTDLVEDVRNRLKGLKEGVVDGPADRGGQLSWMTLLPSEKAAARSIFDPQLQLQLRRQLEGERYGQEQFRYFNSLRTRWVTEDLATMKARLVQFTLDRYWR
jgi:hypothetical protein